tara:strand:+ start:474 stop:674 length:201 start_codon:yes stop_codon:yes gene_type:complete
MGKIASLVKEIQREEKLDSLEQVFLKYPHLSELYYEEFKDEYELAGAVDLTPTKESTKADKKLLLD